MHIPFSRRTFLKASGVALALPWLESMQRARGAAASEPPRRLVFICATLGLHPQHLWPSSPGAASSPYLDLLREHRRDFTLFSGLQHEDQIGKQPHDSELTWLSAARGPATTGFHNSISVDQVAADRIGRLTRFPSITLGTLLPLSQSYTNRGVMIPAQTSPAALFAQLFLAGRPEEISARQQQLADGASILDSLGTEVAALRRRGSQADNHLLGDYFASIRSAEQNIQAAGAWLTKPKPAVASEPPADISDEADLLGREKLLLDLVPLIVQTDSSRVISIMIQDHLAVPKVEGVTENQHTLSHHGQNPDKIEQLRRIEAGIVAGFGTLLGRLKAQTEAGPTLLDSTAVLFGSNLGNANAHHAHNLPIILSGGGFPHGRYVTKPAGTPLSNLFVTMLNRSGIAAGSFGQSTGTLDW